jgi:hypothetical protein
MHTTLEIPEHSTVSYTTQPKMKVITGLAKLAPSGTNGERPRLNSPLSLATLHYQNPFEYL